MTRSRIRAISLPSSDRVFAAVVDAALRDEPALTAEQLEQRLREWAPDAMVRSSELSGEAGATWYVYRDGRYQADDDASWQGARGTPWARFDAASGVVLAANEEFGDLVGYATAELAGRPYGELVYPEAVHLAERAYAQILRGDDVHSVVQLRAADGSPVAVEYVARVVDDGVEGWYRPIRVHEGTAGRS